MLEPQKKKTQQKPQNPHLYTLAFSENYKTHGTPHWKVMHRKHDHAVAKFKCEPGPLHTLVKSRTQRTTQRTTQPASQTDGNAGMDDSSSSRARRLHPGSFSIKIVTKI